MHKEKLLKREGGHVVLIGGGRGMSLVTVCRAKDADAEVTIAGRSPDKLLQAQQELGPVHTIVMDMTDEGAVKKVFARLGCVDHVLISAGTICNGPMYTMRCLVHSTRVSTNGPYQPARCAAPRPP